jgi:Zn-finger nucleic acid-binding protein
MTDRQGVEIDYCPKCRGVWLDRGELDKIIERSAEYETKQVPPPVAGPKHEYDRGYQQDPYYKHKKKKGFLGDFFDFD